MLYFCVACCSILIVPHLAQKGKQHLHFLRVDTMETCGKQRNFRGFGLEVQKKIQALINKKGDTCERCRLGSGV